MSCMLHTSAGICYARQNRPGSSTFRVSAAGRCQPDTTDRLRCRTAAASSVIPSHPCVCAVRKPCHHGMPSWSPRPTGQHYSTLSGFGVGQHQPGRRHLAHSGEHMAMKPASTRAFLPRLSNVAYTLHSVLDSASEGRRGRQWAASSSELLYCSAPCREARCAAHRRCGCT